MLTDEEFYRFEKIRNREGNVSSYHNRFVDNQDFQIHPQLLKAINFDACKETSPEGRALWLYVRLCQVLKYDEGYFYRDYRDGHPNDDPYRSFQLVSKVTTETPVTCFNFSRIATKLLNQIPSVHALMIAVGNNKGHFRFGYYTDKVSVDAEPTTPKNHYNDMARIKLGIEPQGLKVFNGQDIIDDLMKRVAQPMLEQSRRSLPVYLAILHDLPSLITTQVDIKYLVQELKAQGVDGAGVVQVLLQTNHQFSQPPYQMARAGLTLPDEQINHFTYRNVQPQLLVREKGKGLTRIDLTTLDTNKMSWELYAQLLKQGRLIYPDEYMGARFELERGIQL